MSASLFGTGGVINVNVNGSLVPQSFVGAAGQTLFLITNFTYTIGANSLLVFINGQRQISGRDFTETSTSSFTLLEGVVAGDFVDIIGFPQVTLSSSDASTQLYTQTAVPGALVSTVRNKLNERVSVKDFGAVGNGVADDTAAILAAFNAINISGGGTLYFPSGNYIVTTLPLIWTTNQTINLKGDGQTRTKIIKSTVDANPTVAMSCSVPGAQDIFSEFADMTIVGCVSSPALRITNLARFDLRNLKCTGGSIGFHNRGSLVFNSYDCNYNGNASGYLCVTSGGIFCNLINFHGGAFNNNTLHGIDLDGANSVHFYGCDIEANGTLATPTTGDVITQATIGAESGYSLIGFHGTWHESNLGTGFKANAAAGLSIILDHTYMILGASGDINIGAIDEVTFINAFASGTVNVAAFKSIYIGGQFPGVLNDTSSHTTAVERQVGATILPFQVLETGIAILSMSSAGTITATNLTLTTPAVLLNTSIALTNGAGVGAGTITNAPAAGNPTKWISINDNGTIRKIPAW